MRYAERTRTRVPSGIPTPNPTLSAELDEGDVCGIALAVDSGGVKIDVNFEVDADVVGSVEALLRLVMDAAVLDVVEVDGLDVDVVGSGELVVDVTPIVVRTLGVPSNRSVLKPLLQSQPPPSRQQYESTPLLAHF